MTHPTSSAAASKPPKSFSLLNSAKIEALDLIGERHDPSNYTGGFKQAELPLMSLACSSPVKSSSRDMASVSPYGMGVSSGLHSDGKEDSRGV